ncbi:MAG TPA: heme-copper oxidase subunit III [Pyrinomonadaceae bacterium]|nr:heme-copper oxidase subunit III [Pyrinomonadaceae bacterium]
MVTRERKFGSAIAGIPVAGGPGDPRATRRSGSGGDPDDLNETEYERSFPKSRVLTWFLMLVVLMTFGGVIGAYVVISTNGVLEWNPFDLPVQVWISTAIILASSGTYVAAEGLIRKGNQPPARTWLLATTVLGAAFISSQILAWYELVKRGIYMQSNPYAGFFYILTALHAVHVAGGIIALGYVVLMVWEKPRFEAKHERATDIAGAVGWYWHFMGALWIVLFVLLGFWK